MPEREVELHIPGKFKDEPFFYFVIKNYDVMPFILEASFSTEMGWAIVRFEGENDELDRLFSFLEEKGVKIDYSIKE